MRRLPAIALVVLLGGASDTQSGWTFKISRDAISDKETSTAEVSTKAGVISLLCDPSDDNPLTVVLQSAVYLGGRGSGVEFRDLSYRFDGRQAVTARWAYMQSVALLRDTDRAIQFSKEVAGASTLLIRAERYDYRTVDLLFPMRGARDAVAKVVTYCADKVAAKR